MVNPMKEKDPCPELTLQLKMYEIEIKTTLKSSTKWHYRKAQIDTMRYYHPKAILMVYIQPEHTFYAQRIDRIDWENVVTSTTGSMMFYEMNLQSTLLNPTELFDRVTPDDYYPFLEGTKQLLGSFA